MSAIKEKPILFSAPMVRAILDGRKTQTRRIIKPQPQYEILGNFPCWNDPQTNKRIVCPYGHTGDQLWVRETLAAESYAAKGWNAISYKADDDEVCVEAPEGWSPPRNNITTHRESGDNIPQGGFDYYTAIVPSIFMPRWASRITLEITGVRVERLNDISEADAVAEGIAYDHSEDGLFYYVKGLMRETAIDSREHRPAIQCYAKLWGHINGAGSWDLNPWVWCIEFKRI